MSRKQFKHYYVYIGTLFQYKTLYRLTSHNLNIIQLVCGAVFTLTVMLIECSLFLRKSRLLTIGAVRVICVTIHPMEEGNNWSFGRRQHYFPVWPLRGGCTRAPSKSPLTRGDSFDLRFIEVQRRCLRKIDGTALTSLTAMEASLGSFRLLHILDDLGCFLSWNSLRRFWFELQGSCLICGLFATD